MFLGLIPPPLPFPGRSHPYRFPAVAERRAGISQRRSLLIEAPVLAAPNRDAGIAR